LRTADWESTVLRPLSSVRQLQVLRPLTEEVDQDAADKAGDEGCQGRKMAKIGPRRLYVTKMLSTPVWGVDSRKETVDPLLAPCLCRDMPPGLRRQEHKGSGMPKSVAFSTGRNPPTEMSFHHLL